MKAGVYIWMLMVVAAGAAGVYYVGVHGQDAELKPIAKMDPLLVGGDGAGGISLASLAKVKQQLREQVETEMKAKLEAEQARIKEQMKAQVEAEMKAQLEAKKGEIQTGAAVFQQGVMFFNMGKYELAQKKFMEVAKKLPEMPPSARASVTPMLNLYLIQIKLKMRQKAVKEAAARKHLASGKKALAEGRLGEAAAAFGKAQDAGVSLGSETDAELRTLSKQAATRLRQQREKLWDDYEHGVTLYEARSYEQALKVFGAILGSGVPLGSSADERVRDYHGRLQAHFAKEVATTAAQREADERAGKVRAAMGAAKGLMARGKFVEAHEQLMRIRISAHRLIGKDRDAFDALLAQATYKLKEKELMANVPPGMVAVPAGEFTMGGESADNVKPAHKVSVRFFYVDKHEVTNAEYKKFLDWIQKTGHVRQYCHPDEPADWNHTPCGTGGREDFYSWRRGTHPKGKGGQPVVLVSWWDA